MKIKCKKFLWPMTAFIVLLASCYESPPQKPPPPPTDIKPEPLCGNSADEPCLVEFSKTPVIYSGGFADTELTLPDGIKFEDLKFQVGDPPTVDPKTGALVSDYREGVGFLASKYSGMVSLSQPAGAWTPDDRLLDIKKKTIRYLAGPLPGEYGLYATYEGKLVGYTVLEVNDVINKDNLVVPLSTTDPNKYSKDDLRPPNKYLHKATYSSTDRAPFYRPEGSSRSTKQPSPTSRNALSGFPKQTEQIGVKRVLLVMVEFDDALYGSDADYKAAEKKWLDVMYPTYAGAPQRNVAQYYDEISGGLLAFEVYPFGRVRVNARSKDVLGETWNKTSQKIINQMLTLDRNGNKTPDVDEIEDKVTGHRYNLEDIDIIVYVAPSINQPCQPTNGSVEICDGLDNDCDGNIDMLDDSVVTSTCPAKAECGNGVVEKGEVCDPGSYYSYRGCSNDCQTVKESFPWPMQWKATYAIGDSKQRTFPIVEMPERWEEIYSGIRSNVDTLAHELGHTLGLDDLYSKDDFAVKRELGPWSLMSDETGLPSISLSEKLSLGWLDTASIFYINARTMDLEESRRLSVINSCYVDSMYNNRCGQRYPIGGELKLSEGHSLYFEYRLGANSALSDQGPSIPHRPDTEEGRILISERIEGASDRRVITPPPPYKLTSMDIITRPFTQGSHNAYLYEAYTSTTDPLKISISHSPILTVPEKNISFSLVGKYVDPYILGRPYRGNQFMSPSIQISNAKKIGPSADPNFKYDIWVKHRNDIIADIYNGGNNYVKDVVVNFYEHDYTTQSNADARLIGSVTVPRIEAGGKTTAVLKNWVPTRVGHYCVTVSIEPYEKHNYKELNPNNNTTRSNFEAGWSKSASPATRTYQKVLVGNPFDMETYVSLRLKHTSDLFHTYISESLLKLGPNEKRYVLLEQEFALDNLEAYLKEMRLNTPPTNHISLEAEVLDPKSGRTLEKRVLPLDGVNYEARAGIALLMMTEISIPKANIPTNVSIGGWIYKKSERLLDRFQRQKIEKGTVFMSIYYKGEDSPDLFKQELDPNRPDGSMAFMFSEKAKANIDYVELEYLPASDSPYAPVLWSSYRK